jgi:hypothetical protein
MVSSTSRIAFGSCNEQDLQNNFWSIIEEREPAAFIWGGDAIYGGEFRVEDSVRIYLIEGISPIVRFLTFWCIIGLFRLLPSYGLESVSFSHGTCVR